MPKSKPIFWQTRIKNWQGISLNPAAVDGATAQLLFNPKQLVVLCSTVAAAQGTGLDLAAIGGDC